MDERASTSLPVPDSPLISTVQSVAATRRASATVSCERRSRPRPAPGRHDSFVSVLIRTSSFNGPKAANHCSCKSCADRSCRASVNSRHTSVMNPSRWGIATASRRARRRRNFRRVRAPAAMSNLRSFSTSVVRRSPSSRAACATMPLERSSAWRISAALDRHECARRSTPCSGSRVIGIRFTGPHRVGQY